METIILGLAIIIIVLGVYGAWPLVRGDSIAPTNRKIVRQSNAGKALFKAANPRHERELLQSLRRQVGGAASAMMQPLHVERLSFSTPSRPRLATPPQTQQSLPGAAPVSEVAMLRSQIEQLRTEVSALSSPSNRERFDRPRTRRFRTGVYASLPPILRRQVKEVRSTHLHV